ncbi:hypothetical protein [Thiocystis violacea]|uniref:hypothetical protein n=1 Tax=Thiocystis violacea TaxID=13725 RepID=UPI001904F85A|nr:hypothetical protein [Thiocystis violacea]MBK1721090.1 hypothetical protein [Thiocystis violacea]
MERVRVALDVVEVRDRVADAAPVVAVEGARDAAMIGLGEAPPMKSGSDTLNPMQRTCSAPSAGRLRT